MRKLTGQQLYSFDPEIAEKYGLQEAIFIHNFQFWIALNRKNKVNQIDDRTWTYYSLQAFREKYKYMSINQIRRVIESLVEQKVLVKEFLSKNRFDRTSFYAFTNENDFLPPLREKKPVPTVGEPSALPDSKPSPEDLGLGKPTEEIPQACTPTSAPALAFTFAEGVQADYNSTFTGCNLSILNVQSIMPNLEALFEEFLKKQEEGDLTKKDFKAVFEQAKLELLPKHDKKGLCKWQHLLRSNMFFSLLDTSRITVSSSSSDPVIYQPLEELSPEEKEASMKKLKEIRQQKSAES